MERFVDSVDRLVSLIQVLHVDEFVKLGDRQVEELFRENVFIFLPVLVNDSGDRIGK